MKGIFFQRQKLGLSQSALGKLSGVLTKTISEIESGRINPTDIELEKISSVLKIRKELLLIEIDHLVVDE